MSNLTQRFTDAFSVRQVFGEPVKHGNLTLVPVAKIAGGGGGDANGSGFGGAAKPLGTLVIADGSVRWRPIVEPTAVLAVAGIGLAAFLLLRARKRCHERKSES